MTSVAVTFPLPVELPAVAGGAVSIVRKLVAAGHQALLAGGCVRDLLLGSPPHDYDVATDAPPEVVCQLFPATRLVGAQFGVVLVRRQGRWIEVATFRTDGPYRDGRRPAQVTFCGPEEDARRRDFTVNGMFLDPLRGEVIDYVDGHADLQARLVRAIGDPAARFAEDHLRLLRAVRFAARLGFDIEPATLAAIQGHAATLGAVAAERVREELEKMLQHPGRRQALALLERAGLLPYLWRGATWRAEQVAAADALLARLAEPISFELAFAALTADRSVAEVRAIGQALTFSTNQRETVAWLVEHQADLDEPEAASPAYLKRRMAHPAFDALRRLAHARYAAMSDGPRRAAVLEARLAAIPPEAAQPPPLVTGDDLAARGVPPGPIYKQILDALYEQQLNEVLRGRGDALTQLDQMLKTRGVAGG